MDTLSKEFLASFFVKNIKIFYGQYTGTILIRNPGALFLCRRAFGLLALPPGNSCNKLFRVFCLRSGKNTFRISLFDYTAVLHNQNPVTDPSCEIKVMGNKDHAVFLATVYLF